MEQAAAILAGGERARGGAGARGRGAARRGTAPGLRRGARRRGGRADRDAGGGRAGGGRACACRRSRRRCGCAGRLAAKMAEKIVGRAVEIEPDTLTAIAAQALAASRARAGLIKLRVNPDDRAALERDDARRALLARFDGGRRAGDRRRRRRSAAAAASSRPRRCGSTRGSRPSSRRWSARSPARARHDRIGVTRRGRAGDQPGTLGGFPDPPSWSTSARRSRVWTR